MKESIRRATVMAGLVLVGGTGLSTSPVVAQTRRAQAPPADAPRFMIPTLAAREKKLGVDAADEVRKRVESEFPVKQLYVIPKETMCANLTASGFPCDTVPDPVTARLLAQTLRADEFLEGTVSRTASGYRLETRMVLTRDANMTQPLPVAEAAKLADAARAVANSLKEARKQLEAERACEVSLAAGKAQEAAQHARRAIEQYPNSTIGRVCLANAYLVMKQPADSIIGITSRVIELDQRNRPALRILAQAYKDAGNAERAVETWTRLLAADPKNARLAQEITAEIASLPGQARLAKPIILQAVQENPGDPDLIRLKWLILLTTRDWKEAIATGEEMVRTDTAAADTTFFTRLAAAYASDSQPQRASETTARAVAKFPNNAALWSLHSQTLRLAGQTQQAVQAAQRAISISPRTEHAYLRLAQAQLDLGQNDAAVGSLDQALANGEDAGIVSQILLVKGNEAYKAATQSKRREDFQRAIAILTKADQAQANPTAKFLIGASAVQIGDSAVRENQQVKSCELARMAQDNFNLALINLPQGAAVPDLRATAQQLLGAVQQYDAAVQGQIRRYCR